jgi:hypothetical protein
MHRRTLLQMGGAAAAFGIPRARAAQPSPVSAMDVRQAGARGDGRTKDTHALQEAIDKVARAGGGTVYVPPGIYLTGSLELKTNVTLHVEAGGTLLGSTDLADYRPLPGPNPKGDANDKHLIYARGAENIAITGAGVIDGQGQAFWAPTGRASVAPEDLWRDVATYDWKPLARPSPMVELVECRNVRIHDITLRNSPGWTLRPLACDTVSIRGLKIRNSVIGPNTDGIDPTCSQNVMIADCDIQTGDDTICLKSDNPYGPMRVSRNITVTNCVLSSCCNGFKIGTSTQGGFENITFSNTVIHNGDVPYNQRVIAGLAIEVVDGGWIDGLLISNISMKNVRTPIFLRLGNRGGGQAVKVPGHLRRVTISGVRATGAILTSSITGIPGHRVRDVTISDVQIETLENGKTEWVARTIPEQEQSYPEARMFGRLPGYGLYVRHVDGLRLSGIQISSPDGDPRPMMVCDDVRNLAVREVTGTPSGQGQPFLHWNDVSDASVQGCVAPPETGVYLRVTGEHSRDISLIGNDLSKATKAVDGATAPANAVFTAANRTA